MTWSNNHHDRDNVFCCLFCFVLLFFFVLFLCLFVCLFVCLFACLLFNFIHFFSDLTQTIMEKNAGTLGPLWSLFSLQLALILHRVLFCFVLFCFSFWNPYPSPTPPNNIERSNKVVDNMTPINIVQREEGAKFSVCH